MNGSESSDSQQRLIRQILIYLVNNPEAKDTKEGVRKWWLRECEDSQSIKKELVHEALNSLAALRWLSIRETSRTQKIYGLNKEKLREIEIFIGESIDQDENY